MCRLTSCCCGCSLKTGCQIIGWFTLIFGILGLIGACYQMHQLQSTKNTGLVDQAHSQLIQLREQLNSIQPGAGDRTLGTDNQIREKLEGQLAQAETNAALGIFFNILGIISSICLLIGVNKNSHRFVLVFVIYWSLAIVALLCFTIYFIVAAYQAVAAAGGDEHTHAAVGVVIWIFVIIFLLTALLYLYFTLVAYSLYKELQEAPDVPPMKYKA